MAAHCSFFYLCVTIASRMLKKMTYTGINRMIVLGCMLFAAAFAGAQSSANPFDLGREEIIAPDSSSFRSVSPEISGNPFELFPGASGPVLATQSTEPVEVPKLQQVQQEEQPQQFLFLIVIAILLLLTVMVSISRSQIKRIYSAFFNDIVLRSLYREKGSVTTSIYLSLYLMFVGNLGIFVYLSLRQYNLLIGNSDLSTFLYCITITGSLIAAKHLVLGLISVIFPVSKDMDTYHFVILMFGILTGLLLAPANVFLAYADTGLAKLIITGMAIFLLLFYIMLMLRSLFLVRNIIVMHFFHFLLYLCTVELMPVMLLYKVVTDKLHIPVVY